MAWDTDIVTDSQLKEQISHGSPRFPFQYYEDVIGRDNGKQIGRHWHPEFEISLVQEGEAVFFIENQEIQVKAGDGMFINSGVIHGMQAVEWAKIPNIVFSGTMIGGENSLLYEQYVECFLSLGVPCLHILREIPWQREILLCLEGICAVCREEADPLIIHMETCRLWQLLWRQREVFAAEGAVGISLRTRARLRQMITYIEEHYGERLTLEQIAQAANISRSEAVRCFRKGLGESPVQYVTEYRLSRARSRLLTTADPVTDIALETGFENCSYFDRAFKKRYGMTPQELRRKTWKKMPASPFPGG